MVGHEGLAGGGRGVEGGGGGGGARGPRREGGEVRGSAASAEETFIHGDFGAKGLRGLLVHEEDAALLDLHAVEPAGPVEEEELRLLVAVLGVALGGGQLLVGEAPRRAHDVLVHEARVEVHVHHEVVVVAGVVEDVLREDVLHVRGGQAHHEEGQRARANASHAIRSHKLKTPRRRRPRKGRILGKFGEKKLNFM